MRTRLRLLHIATATALAACAVNGVNAASPSPEIANLLAGRFRWAASAPLIGPASATDQSCAIKDPTLVFHGGRWHLYATIKTLKLTIMEYLGFADWASADAAPRRAVKLDETYHCAPQLFFFRPQRKWYLIYQWADKTPATGFFGPAFSTMDDPGKPETLSRPAMLFPKKPENV